MRRSWILVSLLLIGGCAQQLPEPESEGARLYTLYCSSGCHNPIPPGRTNFRVWEMQYGRMLEVMEKSQRKLPTSTEQEIILDYLRRHALH